MFPDYVMISLLRMKENASGIWPLTTCSSRYVLNHARGDNVLSNPLSCQPRYPVTGL